MGMVYRKIIKISSTVTTMVWKYTVILNRLCRSQKRQFSILLATTIIILSCIFLRKPVQYSDFSKTKDLIESQLSHILLTEKGTGCEMPRLDPISYEAIMHNKEAPKIICKGIDWVKCYKSECFVTQQILDQMKNIECTYRDIIFVRDDYYNYGKATKIIGRDKYMLNKSDHVKVYCTGIDVKGFNLERSRWSGNGAGFRPLQYFREKSLNILILMHDSASRNGFIRRMPTSYKVLTEELQAVVLNSYNILGDGTPCALFPILTGHMDLELEDSRKNVNNKYVDIKPFLFSVLKEQGYRTAYNEEMPNVGTFQYRFNGFEHQPTDHYLRPFLKEEYNGRWMNYCIGAEPQYRFLLNITKQFLDLEGKKFCLTFMADLSHDNFDMITAADKSLASFLKMFKDEGHLEDTLLIVMGDHGPRYESMRLNYQGKIDERLPFVSIVLPEKLKKERPEALINLQENSNVLTTHYDMHTSLLDALGLKKYRNSYKVPGSDIERGLSFFRPIPITRSCAEAGIMPHWCACAKWLNVSSMDAIYTKAARALADYIDSISEVKRSVCASRKLSEIAWVQRQSPNILMLGFQYSKEIDSYIGKYEKSKHVKAETEYYQVKIVLSPGRSVFEGSMQYIVKEDLFVISERDISRVNAYGAEPKCVSATYPHLNKYCYCKDRQV